MAKVINRIAITKVDIVGTGENTFDVKVAWLTKTTGKTPYSGDYILQIITNDNVVAEKTIQQSAGLTNEGTIPFSSPELSYSYYIRICDESRERICENVLLLFDTYQLVLGSYHDEMLDLMWDKPKTTIKQGLLEMISLTDPNDNKTKIAPYVRHIDYHFSLKDFDMADILKVHLIPQIDEISSGPPSPNMFLFVGTPVITGLDLSSIKSHDLIVKFTQPYSDLTTYGLSNDKLYVFADIVNDGKTSYAKGEQVFQLPKDGDSYVLTIHIEQDLSDESMLEHYEVRLYLGSLDIVNKTITDWSTQKFNKIHVETSTKIDPILMNGEVTALAYSEGEEENQYMIPINHELFRQAVTETIQVDGITLSRVEQGPELPANQYHLTVQTDTAITRNAFTDFLTLLDQHQILASGLYELVDLIARHAAVNLTDTMFMYAKLNNEKRSAELRPGFGLQIETAVYQPIYDADHSQDAAPGYISTNHVEYVVTSVNDHDDIHLTLNPYIEQFADHISIAYPNGIFSGGVLDFFSNGMRQPYYKIIYPSQFLTSDLEGTNYFSDNVVILAADSYTKLQEAEDIIVTLDTFDPTAVDIPVMIVRGRSAVTLTVPISYMGQQGNVPIGTTLMNLLESKGVTNDTSVTVTLKRLTNSGYSPIKLYAGTDIKTFWRSIVLMAGDRIEVSN